MKQMGLVEPLIANSILEWRKWDEWKHLTPQFFVGLQTFNFVLTVFQKKKYLFLKLKLRTVSYRSPEKH